MLQIFGNKPNNIHHKPVPDALTDLNPQQKPTSRVGVCPARPVSLGLWPRRVQMSHHDLERLWPSTGL